MAYPPSPALSCSDLMSNEDLDAYFDKLGCLSCLPTPPMKEIAFHKVAIQEHELLPTAYNGIATESMAKALSYISCRATGGDAASASTIAGYIKVSLIPVETIALAHNILAELRVSTRLKRHDSAGPEVADLGAGLPSQDEKSVAGAQPELFVLAALQIATSFLQDHPMKLSSWSEEIGQKTFSIQELRKMNSHILSRLNWQLYTLASPNAIDTTISTFKGCQWPPVVSKLKVDTLANLPELRLDGQTMIENGQITPGYAPSIAACFEH